MKKASLQCYIETENLIQHISVESDSDIKLITCKQFRSLQICPDTDTWLIFTEKKNKENGTILKMDTRLQY